jgi:hypothetical protein
MWKQYAVPRMMHCSALCQCHKGNMGKSERFMIDFRYSCKPSMAKPISVTKSACGFPHTVVVGDTTRLVPPPPHQPALLGGGSDIPCHWPHWSCCRRSTTLVRARRPNINSDNIGDSFCLMLSPLLNLDGKQFAIRQPSTCPSLTLFVRTWCVGWKRRFWWLPISCPT